MLLSIDRVLKLLVEKKSISKIAELAETTEEAVIEIIEDARQLLIKHEKPLTKRKIIIKKKQSDTPDNESSESHIFEGADLSAVPVQSTLTMYTDGASKGNPGPAGIGIVILDQDDHQVGKVSLSIGKGTNNFAECTALIRALEIGAYFKAHTIKIRTDSELVVKQISGEYAIKNVNLKKLHHRATELSKQFKHCKIDHVSRNFNEKADYLAKKAIS